MRELGIAENTLVVAMAALLLAIPLTYRPFYLLGQAALWVVVILSVVSAVDYYRKYARATALS